MVAGLNASRQFREMLVKDGKIINALEQKQVFPESTMIGALSKYISIPNEKFQPMNANFGILPGLEEKIRDKKLRYEKLASRAIEDLKKFIKILQKY